MTADCSVFLQGMILVFPCTISQVSDKVVDSLFEQINMINQLDEEDRTVVFKIIDTMLTKKKFKDFFNSNVAAL
jgi:hypothetical protein